MSNNTEHFSYKGGCGECEYIMYIEALKKELVWDTDKCLQVSNNKMLFNNSCTTKKLKKILLLKFKKYGSYVLLCDT